MLNPKQYDVVMMMTQLAIEQKVVIAIRYKGIDRLIEPHALGNNGKIRAWQVASTDGKEPGWRLFDIIKMEPATFTPRPDYVQNDALMTANGGIVAQVS